MSARDDLSGRHTPPPKRAPLAEVAARDSFAERNPARGRGRDSIPRSHHGEGINYVD